MVFDKYLFKTLFIATVFMAVTLAVIIFLTQSLRFLELVIESGASSLTFWILTFLAMPRFLEVVLPFALMAATLFTYNKLSVDSELVVMQASGYSPMRLANPVISLSIFVTLFLLFVTMWLAPTSLDQMQKMRQIVKSQYSSLLIKEGVFNEIGDDLTVYVENRTRDGELEGLMIYDTSPEWETPVTVLAKRGVIVSDESGQQVIVYEGSRQDFNQDNNALNRLDFERYTIDLPEDEAVRQRWQEPDERTFFELLNPDQNIKRDRDSAQEFINEAHRRIVSPFLVPAYALIALSFLLLGPLNRRGQALRIAGAIGAAVFIQGLYLFAYNLTAKTPWGLVIMYALVFTPIVFSFMALSSWSEGLRRKLAYTKTGAA